MSLKEERKSIDSFLEDMTAKFDAYEEKQKTEPVEIPQSLRASTLLHNSFIEGGGELEEVLKDTNPDSETLEALKKIKIIIDSLSL